MGCLPRDTIVTMRFVITHVWIYVLSGLYYNVSCGVHHHPGVDYLWSINVAQGGIYRLNFCLMWVLSLSEVPHATDLNWLCVGAYKLSVSWGRWWWWASLGVARHHVLCRNSFNCVARTLGLCLHCAFTGLCNDGSEGGGSTWWRRLDGALWVQGLEFEG